MTRGEAPDPSRSNTNAGRAGAWLLGALAILVCGLAVATRTSSGLEGAPEWVASVGCGVAGALGALALGLARRRLAAFGWLAWMSLGQGAIWALHSNTQWHQQVFDPFYIFGGHLRGVGLLALLYGAVVVGFGGRAWWRRRPPVPIPRLLVASLILLSGAGIVMPNIAPFSLRFVSWALLSGFAASALGAVNLVLFALALDDDALPKIDLEGEVWTKRIKWGAAAFVVVASSVFALTVLQGAPTLEDDIAMSWQARYYAAGQLYLQPPPELKSFHLWLLASHEGRWFSYSPPGWPMALSIGYVIGAPWLINPLIGGGSVLLVHRICDRLHSRRVANVVTLLLAASPWFLAMNGSRLAHPLTLALALVALAGVEAATRDDRAGPMVVAGLAVGALAGVRTYDALTAGLPLGIFALARCRNWPVRLRLSAVGGLGSSVTVGLTLLYNHLVTGHWATFPNNIGMGTEFDVSGNVIGFGPDKDLGRGWRNLDPLPGHGLPDVLVNGNHNLYYVHAETIGIIVGVLGAIALLVVLGLRLAREDRLWLGIAATVSGAYSMYWFSGGAAYGAKYWYVLMPSAVVLPALWGVRVHDTLRGSALRRLGPAALVATLVLSGLHFLPWRGVDRYLHRKHSPANLAALEQTHGWDNALVFVTGASSENFGHAFLRNRLTLDGPGPVYARAVDAATDARVAAHYEGREVWRIKAPRLPRDLYEVIAGPPRWTGQPSK